MYPSSNWSPPTSPSNRLSIMGGVRAGRKKAIRPQRTKSEVHIAPSQAAFRPSTSPTTTHLLLAKTLNRTVSVGAALHNLGDPTPASVPTAPAPRVEGQVSYSHDSILSTPEHKSTKDIPQITRPILGDVNRAPPASSPNALLDYVSGNIFSNTYLSIAERQLLPSSGPRISLSSRSPLLQARKQLLTSSARQTENAAASPATDNRRRQSNKSCANPGRSPGYSLSSLPAGVPLLSSSRRNVSMVPFKSSPLRPPVTGLRRRSAYAHAPATESKLITKKATITLTPEKSLLVAIPEVESPVGRSFFRSEPQATSTPYPHRDQLSDDSEDMDLTDPVLGAFLTHGGVAPIVTPATGASDLVARETYPKDAKADDLSPQRETRNAPSLSELVQAYHDSLISTFEANSQASGLSQGSTSEAALGFKERQGSIQEESRSTSNDHNQDEADCQNTSQVETEENALQHAGPPAQAIPLESSPAANESYNPISKQRANKTHLWKSPPPHTVRVVWKRPVRRKGNRIALSDLTPTRTWMRILDEPLGPDSDDDGEEDILLLT